MKYSKAVMLINCWALLFSMVLLADENFDSGGEEDIKGLIIDRTVTLVGLHFVRELGDYRRLHDINMESNLTVYERPSARWGSLIWVVSDREEVYRQFVSPKIGDIPQYAQQASDLIDKQLLRIKIRQLMLDTFDLDKKEL